MRRRLLVLLCGLTATASVSAAQRSPVPARPPGTRRALIVAVGDYLSPAPPRGQPRWNNLYTALDAANLRSVLVEKYGFHPADVLTLQDRGATRKEILAAFQRHLIGPVKPGDVVLFSFAGHGQPVADDNGDEQDGRDESLVPYDYLTQSAKDGARTNLRDDDLQRLLKELTDRMRPAGGTGPVEGNVTVVVDSCHSGTIVRGNLVTRGRGWDARIDGPLPPTRGSAPGKVPPDTDGAGFTPAGAALASGYVAITAAQSDESAVEIFSPDQRPLGGALTYSLCRALREATPATTYRDLFARIRADVKAYQPFQTPTLDGERDQLLFSGRAAPAPAYPRVVKFVPESGEVKIAAGHLHGITPRSRFALYDVGVDPRLPQAPRLAELTVADVSAYLAAGKLPEADRKRLAGRNLRGAKAVLTAMQQPDQVLRVLLDGTGPLARVLRDPAVPPQHDPVQVVVPPPTVARSARGCPQVPFDFRVVRRVPGAPGANGSKKQGARSAARLVVLRNDDTEAWSEVEGPGTPARLRRVLEGLWRWRFLSTLQPGRASRYQVSLRVIPIERVGDGFRDRPAAKNGDVVLREGDLFQIELQNHAPFSVHATVLDLQQNGQISVLFPTTQENPAQQSRLPGGSTVRIPHPYEVIAPFGTDILKVIATPDYVDFSPVEFRDEDLTRGSAPTAPRSTRAILKLLAHAGQRGEAARGSLDPDNWGATSITLLTRALTPSETQNRLQHVPPARGR